VNPRGAVPPRRWQSAIAIIATLSLFFALIAGWALRHALAAAPLPQPAAASQGISDGISDVGANAGHLQLRQIQLHARSNPTSRVAHFSSLRSSTGSSPTNHKPLKGAWMTRDRPQTWAPLAPHWAWTPWVVSLATWGAAAGAQPADVHSGAPAAALGDHDVLTQLCVVRR
jgi:hypothetical protein